MAVTRYLHPLVLIAAAILLLVPGAARAGGPAPAVSPAVTQPSAALVPAAVVRIDGPVDDYSRDQLKIRFDRAKAAGAKVIVLEIDTYGGLVTSGLDISRFLKNQRDVRTIAFVNSKAISAGAMIALACDEIVMTPSGTLGDCAPIQVAPFGGMASMGATERSKAESPVLADFQESAEKRGYPPLLALAMVSIPYTVHWVEDGKGTRRFVDTSEYEKLEEAGGWKPVSGEDGRVDGPESLLTVHTDQAIHYGLATGTAGSADELAAARNLTLIARYEGGVGDRIVSLLAGPTARILLLIVFINALFIALKTPGSGGPEAVALLALGVLVGVPLLTGYATWLEVLMIVGGISLILFEVFVLPGHLVSIFLGGLLLVGGVGVAFVGDVWSIPGAWDMPKSWTALQRGIQVTVLGLAGSLLLLAWLKRYLPQMPVFNRLILSEPADGPAAAAAAHATAPQVPPVVAPVPGFAPAVLTDPDDRWPFLGTVGLAVSDLKPGGTVRFPYADDTRVASVVSQGGYVRAGAKVVVREVHGNHVVVREVV